MLEGSATPKWPEMACALRWHRTRFQKYTIPELTIHATISWLTIASFFSLKICATPSNTGWMWLHHIHSIDGRCLRTFIVGESAGKWTRPVPAEAKLHHDVSTRRLGQGSRQHSASKTLNLTSSANGIAAHFFTHISMVDLDLWIMALLKCRWGS
jgi:hypothetical protein